MLRGWAAALLFVAIALSAGGCTSSSTPFAKNGLGELSSRAAPPVSVTAMNGLPPDKSAVLAVALATSAARREVGIVQGSFAEGYKLAGEFQAFPQGNAVTISHRWVLTGNTGGVLYAFSGDETVPAKGPDPWAAVDQTAILRIAAVTSENLSSGLASLGFSTRGSGMPPPLDAFVKAGPGAEKEIDYETYYGSLAAAASQGVVLPPPPGALAAPPAANTQSAAALPPPTELNPPAATSPKVAAKQPAATSPPAAATQPSLAIPPAAPAAGKAEIRAVAVTAVSGSPGEGNAELARAMRRTLTEVGWPVLEAQSHDAFVIVGQVSLGPRSGPSQMVRLAWTVKWPDGRVIGTIKQENSVPSGSLDKGWGDTAYYATQAASEGIFQLVNKVR